MKRLIFCVTNDLCTDQRMERICTSLQLDGRDVLLVGRRQPGSKDTDARDYRQHRLPMFFSKGKLFYIEYNIRLFFFLLWKQADAFIAIDLDTIIPVYLVSVIKKKTRIYDAHELFSEMKELVRRPRIQKLWLWVEKTFVPRFPNGYTVSSSIRDEFRNRYGVEYILIRNLPLLAPPQKQLSAPAEKFLIYQGAVNEGRGFEWLIPAMKQVNAPLKIYGEGNFSDQCRSLIRKYGLEEKVQMMGTVKPAELKIISQQAYAGINLVEPVGLNQLYSLANKFFDYIHAGIPQLTMDFPEYRKVNETFEVAVLIGEMNPEIIAAGLNKLLQNEVFYSNLRNNCQKAALVLNWQAEEQVLKNYYHKILD